MLVDYGSDSDGSGEDQVKDVPPKPVVQPAKAKPAPASSLSASLPKPRRRDGPLKITLEAPKRSVEEDGVSDTRPAKKAKLEGAGGSSLLAMLPPPKNKNATLPKKKEDSQFKPPSQLPGFGSSLQNEEEEVENEDVHMPKSSLFLVPPSRIAKGKEVANRVEETTADFFSLGEQLDYRSLDTGPESTPRNECKC
jgi:hypothetical protein